MVSARVLMTVFTRARVVYVLRAYRARARRSSAVPKIILARTSERVASGGIVDRSPRMDDLRVHGTFK